MKLHDISKQLGSALEARMLVKHVTGLSDADLITNDNIQLTESQQSQLDDMIQQRLNDRPVSKIIGVKEFYGREFIVSDDVLDPRPDSEVLIEAVLDCGLNRNDELRILDLGTGSGCLILTLLAELPNARGNATDISDKALSIARRNAEKIGVSDRIDFIKSDWFESVEDQFDIIISNPPYIETKDIQNLQRDVRDYDPLSALDGGEDGLEPYKVILPQIRRFLKKDGLVALEHGKGQCGRIKEIAEGYGLSGSRTVRDLSGRDRVFIYIHK